MIETAAATPAPCPVTVQAIMLRMAVCEILSPATQRPATSRFFTRGGTRQPYGTFIYWQSVITRRVLWIKSRGMCNIIQSPAQQHPPTIIMNVRNLYICNILNRRVHRTGGGGGEQNIFPYPVVTGSTRNL